MIENYENILNKEQYAKLGKILKDEVKWVISGYSAPESAFTIPKFWYADLNSFEFVTKDMLKISQEKTKKSFTRDRVYANGQAFGQDGGWHIDSNLEDEYTFLYYFTKHEDFSIIGETYFYLNEKYICNIPQTNSGVLFNANIKHRGMGPKREMIDMRISVAFKLKLFNGIPKTKETLL